jgi:hypothetical protein
MRGTRALPFPGKYPDADDASVGGLAGLRATHADLLGRTAQPHLFDRIDWMEPLHRLCMADMPADIRHAQIGGAQCWLFLADAGDRRRVALANWYSFAFRPVFVGAPGETVQAHLLTTIARNLLPDVAQIELYPLPADDGTLALVQSAFRSAGWITVPRAMGTSHYLDLAGRDFEQYWSGRPAVLRNTVRRKSKNATLSFSRHTALTDALWADYEAVYRRSWKPQEGSMPFLRELAETEGKAGTLRLGFAREADYPIAAQLWTVENGTALIHKLAHDQGADDASPGTLLSHFLFRQAIDTDRVAHIDYGTGNNAYKKQWMERKRPLIRLDCFNPRFASAWLPAARTAISRLIG